MRKIIAALSAAVMVVIFTSCAAPMDADSFKGEWALFTVDGAETEADGMVRMIVTDSEIISKSASAEGSYGYMTTAEGFSVRDGNGVVFLSVVYSQTDDTLSYTIQQDGKSMEYVFVRAELVPDPAAEEAGQ